MPSQIGPYRVEREIARGGMGIVYLARDTRLDRAVAIKALPDDVAADPERLARFEREAKTLASLNHPNVAGIYGIEVSGDRRYLVLEHIEGETLATRISRGKLPLAESLEICAQIAAGVEAAHESGVIHRDLKPGNVMITPGEHVKVLDFGLAKGKVAESESGPLSSPATTDSPTLSSPTLPHSPSLLSPATMPGVILGTAAYLSPEQARGKAVDRRTDIWSFGCVLYECLMGKRVFEGETVGDTIAKILERDVDWKSLPSSTPPRIRELLQRCLEKDPRKRLRDIGEARLSLEAARAGATGATAVGPEILSPPSRNPLVRWREGMRSHGFLFAIGLILGALLALRMWGPWGTDESPAIRGVMRLSITVPSDLKAFDAELSPDGTMDGIIAEPHVAGNAKADVRPRIYLRHLDKTAFEPVRGTEGALSLEFSADNRWILFAAPVSERSAQLRVLRVPIDGSAPPVPVVEWREEWSGNLLVLSTGDMLVATGRGKSYVRIPRDGGTPSTPTNFDAPDSGAIFALTRLLPGERGALLRAVSYDQGAYHEGVAVVDLKSGKTRILVRDGGGAYYTRTGHLLYARHDVIYAAPFDLRKLVMTGDPVPVMDGLRTGPSWANASFDLSRNGILQISPEDAGWAARHAVIATPGGQVSDWSGERQAFEVGFHVSPDGTRFIAVIATPKSLYEIWVSERGRRSSRRVISSPDADCGSPCWSPDGAQIAFLRTNQSDQDGVYVAPASGNGPSRLLFRTGSGYSLGPLSWSPDGKKILATMQGTQKTQLVCISASGQAGGEPGKKPEPLFGGGSEHRDGAFSPDGHWIAFVSDETGKAEVYVSQWDGNGPTGETLMISDGGGDNPRWGRDGRGVYYHTLQEKMMVVSISSKPRPAASSPALAWDLEALRIASPLLDVLPDGSLVGVQKSEGENDVTRFDITLNFFDELKKRMAAAKK
ncbi:MAG TPA: protein kinase [Candidatus Polarisedimenticolia bacterium]|nr:protein kinase [Candidatus Polarisedimenticolia bacterium]